MKRKDFLALLREKHGLDLRYYQLDYIINTNMLEGVTKNADGDRVFTDDHVRRVLELQLQRHNTTTA